MDSTVPSRTARAAAIHRAGFDPTRRTFFTWLGVVPYLTRAAVLEHLAFMSGLAGGAHVVFDYADPPESYAAKERGAHAQLAERVAKLGEGFVTYFDPTDLAQQLTRLGYSHVDDLGPVEICLRS